MSRVRGCTTAVVMSTAWGPLLAPLPLVRAARPSAAKKYAPIPAARTTAASAKTARRRVAVVIGERRLSGRNVLEGKQFRRRLAPAHQMRRLAIHEHLGRAR